MQIPGALLKANKIRAFGNEVAQEGPLALYFCTAELERALSSSNPAFKNEIIPNFSSTNANSIRLGRRLNLKEKQRETFSHQHAYEPTMGL
ncbi:hypothetical protein J7426_23010 [Tropicibacter sp. R16_0]|uniref:hypothetical protein n=1 Tax=Tropicibacter sp. R16_0 TaxID=2821102 RepID=UPI001ADB2645|nr:hypothetical protein [Tropicibacter sp. R16_0]MBO9453151.1 hypothetical protein [Tropicibacter sp. R16_0]